VATVTMSDIKGVLPGATVVDVSVCDTNRELHIVKVSSAFSVYLISTYLTRVLKITLSKRYQGQYL
jgi:hypothetical protein